MNKDILLEMAKSLKFVFSNAWKDHHRNVYIKSGKAVALNNKCIAVYPLASEEEYTIPGSELHNFLNRTTAKEIKITDKVVSGGRTRFSYKPYGADFSPDDILKVVPTEFHSLPEGFWEAVKWVLPGVHPNKEMKIVDSVYFNRNECVTTDSQRFLVHKLNGRLTNSFLLQAFFLKELIKFDFDEYLVEQDRVWFKKGEFIVGVTQTKGEFQEYEQYFEEVGEYLSFSEEAQAALKEMSVVLWDTEYLDQKIILDVYEGEFTINANGLSGKIEYKEEIDTNIEVCCTFHPNYLMGALEFTDKILIKDGALLAVGEDRKSVFAKEDM